jgi:cytochrome c biogenesis protein CcmG/thiol:disulfide interchange protein DsbE
MDDQNTTNDGANLRRSAMTTRWIVAAAAAVGVGVLAVPMLMGRTERVQMEEPGLMASHETRTSCKADGKANLDFTVKDMNGGNVRLADYKGQVILLNFWATWCGPCKVEIPAFIELYDQYREKGFVVLGVSGDDDAETLRAFAKDMKMNYPVLVGRDHEDLLDAYGPLWGYPTTFFIGRDGAICGKHMGPATKEEFEREIKALL